LTIPEFLKQTASNTPVPGGGSVAALSAAVAASLVEMVAHLTIGKKGLEAAVDEMKAIVSMASGYRETILNDIDRDSDAFNQVMAAFRLPKKTEEEVKERHLAIQEGLKTAALVPLSVAQKAFRIMKMAGTVVIKGNQNAVTDGVVAAMMARTAVLSALYNVKINLTSIEDNAFVKEVDQKVKKLETETELKENEIRLHVIL
jgi:formiminotetrahydrofolate cyclodeaminase